MAATPPSFSALSLTKVRTSRGSPESSRRGNAGSTGFIHTDQEHTKLRFGSLFCILPGEDKPCKIAQGEVTFDKLNFKMEMSPRSIVAVFRALLALFLTITFYFLILHRC